MNYENIEFIDNGNNSLTIRIEGAAYQNLAKMAEVMNTISWCDAGGDNTALTVAETFIFRHETQGLTDPAKALELAEGIADGIDTEAEDEAEDTKRIHELYDAFRKAEFVKE